MFITQHFQSRGVKRGFWPEWLSIATIDVMTTQLLDQTLVQRTSKRANVDVLINITQGATIVTTKDRTKAITIWKNKRKVAV